MGSTVSKHTYTYLQTKMKIVLFSLFAQQFFASPTSQSIFQDSKNAAKFLEKSENSRMKRGLLDRVDMTGEFTTIKAWENFKDTLEELSLPEDEVDRLESCVTKCFWKDQMLDFVGKAYEEKRETWEEFDSSIGKAGTPRPRPCQHCCKALPRTMFGTYRSEDQAKKFRTYPKVGRICMPNKFPSSGKSIIQT